VEYVADDEDEALLRRLRFEAGFGEAGLCDEYGWPAGVAFPLVEMVETDAEEADDMDGERRRPRSCSFLASCSSATPFLLMGLSACQWAPRRHDDSLAQQVIGNVARELGHQLWVGQLLGSRRPRGIGSFLWRGLALVAVMAF
jgi:hypothetical protein